jgi:hypothetical protein
MKELLDVETAWYRPRIGSFSARKAVCRRLAILVLDPWLLYNKPAQRGLNQGGHEAFVPDYPT